jgi:hypothetical protein
MQSFSDASLITTVLLCLLLLSLLSFQRVRVPTRSSKVSWMVVVGGWACWGACLWRLGSGEGPRGFWGGALPARGPGGPPTSGAARGFYGVWGHITGAVRVQVITKKNYT